MTITRSCFLHGSYDGPTCLHCDAATYAREHAATSPRKREAAMFTTTAGYSQPRTWSHVWLEVRVARIGIASIVHSAMWRRLDRGQRRAIGQILTEMRHAASALGDG